MKKITLVVLAVVFVLAGCSALEGTDNDHGSGVAVVAYRAELKEQPVVSLGEDFANGVNGFGFKAAQRLCSGDENFAASPVSIELALAMTRAGASGETAQQMKDTLGLSALTDAQIVEACKSLMWRANTGGMEAANSLWLGKDYIFSEDFISTCTGDFMADAYPLEIPGAMKDINNWVSDKTHEKIEKLLEQEPSDMTELILVNALYYLGDWVQPFEANNTFDETFNATSGAVSASFMHSEWTVPYYENEAFTMISLAFKGGEGEGQYAMALLLPAQGTDVPDMLASLDGEGFAAALSGLGDQQTQIALPKFEYMYGVSLKDTLVAMGMPDAFDPDMADFSGMTGADNDLYISEVLHKCYIRVDELGAEAAAATEVGMVGTAMPVDLKEFRADRPFLFAIYSVEDGTIAFMGVVSDPTQE